MVTYGCDEACFKGGKIASIEKSSANRFKVKSEVYNYETYKPTMPIKETPKDRSKSEQKRSMESSTTKGKRCFKCQGIRHITFDCPNSNIVTMIEDENDEAQSHEEDVELIQQDQ